MVSQLGMQNPASALPPSPNPASTKRPESQAVDQHRKPTTCCRPMSMPVTKAQSSCFEVAIIVKSSCEIAAVSSPHRHGPGGHALLSHVSRRDTDGRDKIEDLAGA